MKRSISIRSIAPLSFLVLVAASIATITVKSDNKLAPADLVAKHLESIGPAEARARTTAARINGTCELTAKAGGLGQSTGKVVMASQKNQNVVNMSFDGESTAFAFDGNKTTVKSKRG